MSAIVVHLLPVERFVSYCADRDIQTSLEHLERLDRGGFVAPLVREARVGSSSRNVYSAFQCYPIWECLNRLRISGPTVDQISDMTDQELGDVNARIYNTLRVAIPQFKNSLQTSNNAALVCQIISNRYYPHTQTDQRTVSLPSVKFNWDWHEYVRLWDAKRVADELGLDPGEILGMQRRIASAASSMDPLREWDDLIRFVSVDQKQRLRGKALLADALRNMATMLSLFYEDVTGERVPEEFSARRTILLSDESPLRELEYVANKYHLNPRPRLILIVEGESETEQMPRLLELIWNLSPSSASIEIVNLRGIDNFTDKKKVRGGAFRQFIDDCHARQTIVYVLLDNEGRADTVKKDLLKAQSAYFQNRKVTKDKYVHIWSQSYEFDNFRDDEIAKALSAVAGSFKFSAQEVDSARQNFKKGKALDKLFQSKTKHHLPKRDLGRELTGILVAEANSIRALPQRPILLELQSIVEAAATNHQPTSGDAWKANQESGHFGDKIR